MLGSGAGVGGGGVGKEAVVSSHTRWKGLSQKTASSPGQEVGKTGWPGSKAFCPSSGMSADRQVRKGKTHK